MTFISDVAVGALTITLLGNDAPLRALLAQYQARTISITVGTSGTQAATTALRGVDAGVSAAARGIGVLNAQQSRGSISSKLYAEQTVILTRSLSGVSGQYGLVSREALIAERALNSVTAAQNRSNAAARASIGAAARIPYAGGLNNAALAASFVSPQLGAVAIAAQLGPTGAVALGLAGIIKLTVDGQKEAKALQQAYLTMTANGVTGLQSVDDSLNKIIASGSDAEKMFSKAELATALAQLAKGGFYGAGALTVMKTATNLAAAEHIKLTDATRELYTNMLHLGLSYQDAASFGDKLARATHLTFRPALGWAVD